MGGKNTGISVYTPSKTKRSQPYFPIYTYGLYVTSYGQQNKQTNKDDKLVVLEILITEHRDGDVELGARHREYDIVNYAT